MRAKQRRRMLWKQRTQVCWPFTIVFCVLTWSLGQSGSAQENVTLSGTARTRTIKVDMNRLVTLLGGEATTPEKVFSLPIDRLVSLGKTPDSGVTLEEQEVRVRGAQLRIDHVGSDPQSFVVVDAREGSIRWARPKENAFLEWRKPAKKLLVTPSPEPQLKPLNRTATIYGFVTQGYEVSQGDSSAYVWVAKEPAALSSVFHAFAALQTALRPAPESALDVILPAAMKLGVPVRVQVLLPQAYIVQEIVAFEQKPWPASDFVMASSWRAIPVEQAHERSEATPCKSCP